MPHKNDIPQFLRPAALALRLGVSRATIWRWVKTGRLPTPVSLSPGVTGWWASELRACLPIPDGADGAAS